MGSWAPKEGSSADGSNEVTRRVVRVSSRIPPSAASHTRSRSGPTDDPAEEVLLGEGGMAKVYLGRQEKLDRAVALKRLGAAAPEPEAIDRLLREARITGRLEHPNIVPVHDIITGPDGLPQVVLKRIEGDTWSALLADPQRIQGQFGAEDVLAWNLEVLMAVARALSFAHSRRVIHRDV
ncbi:MAG: protein kinase, partial [Myxococcota bacterium]